MGLFNRCVIACLNRTGVPPVSMPLRSCSVIRGESPLGNELPMSILHLGVPPVSIT